MKKQPPPFGKMLREKRLARHITLRKFAEMVGVSPTYLSQVEQTNVMPPTADRVKRMAELLGENPHEWIALAGRVPDDVAAAFHKSPTVVPELLQIMRKMTTAQLRQLLAAAERIKSGGE